MNTNHMPKYIVGAVLIVAIVGVLSLLTTGASNNLTGQAVGDPTCTDTDGGLTYTAQGTITGGTWKTTSAVYTDKTDSCGTGGSQVGKIKEYYCSDATHGFYTVKSCATVVGAGYTCVNGACILDSDNDGVADADDVCPGYDDGDDADGDGTPDGCDTSVSEIVIAGSQDGNVYILNAEDGSLVETISATVASEYHGEVVSDVLYISEAVGLHAYDIDDFSSLGTDTAGTYVYDSGGLSYSEDDQPEADEYYMYVGSTSDSVIAIDINNANIYWQYDASSDEDFNKPAMLGTTLYAAGKSGSVYALDTTNINSGTSTLTTEDDYPETLWTYDVDATDTSDLLVGPVAGDAIYVGDDGGYVYALDTDSTVLWSTRVTNARVYGLTTYDDVLYVSASNSVFAVETGAGTVLWEYETGDVVQSEALEADATNYVYFGSDDGYVYAVDAADGSEVWAYNAGEDVNGDPYVVKSVGSLGSVLYIGGESGTVFALDADDGTELWTYSTGSYVRGRPIYYSYN